MCPFKIELDENNLSRRMQHYEVLNLCKNACTCLKLELDETNLSRRVQPYEVLNLCKNAGTLILCSVHLQARMSPEVMINFADVERVADLVGVRFGVVRVSDIDRRPRD